MIKPGSLSPLRVKCVIFKRIWWIDFLSISDKISLRRMPLDHTDDMSSLVQVMAWCQVSWSHMVSPGADVNFITLWDTSRIEFSLLSSQDEMAAISHDIFKCISMNEKLSLLIWISLKFVPEGPIDNKLALVQVIAGRRRGGKPSPEPMLTQFRCIYVALGVDELTVCVFVLLFLILS